jgi:penicillin-binding protein 1A
MTNGTGVGAYFGKLSAGKTGTTDNYADAWFDGYTPALEATVWIGYPQAEIPMTDVHGIAVSGPTFPATIWRLFMERAVSYARHPTDFPPELTSPVWTSHTLQYAMSGGFAPSTTGSYTPTTSATPAPSTSPGYKLAPPPKTTPTTTPPPPPPPPPTTAPPPPPPPPTTAPTP